MRMEKFVLQIILSCVLFLSLSNAQITESESIFVTAPFLEEGSGSIMEFCDITSIEASSSLASLEVSWDSSEDCTEFVVEYTLINYLACPLPLPPESRLAKSIQITQSPARITNLEAYAEYEIQIIGIGDTGFNATRETKASTLEDEPDGPPTQLSVTPSSHSITVSWEPPECQLQNGEIRFYTLTIYNATFSEQLNVEGNEREYIFANLRPYSGYNVEVQTFSVDGEAPGVLKSVQTLEYLPSPPESVETNFQNSTCVNLIWSPPVEQNGILLSYTVAYIKARDQTDWVVEKVPALGNGIQAFLACNLLPGTGYIFRIRASTSAGRGEWNSNLTVSTTRVQLIDAPGKLTVLVNAIYNEFWWSPLNNDDQAGILKRYAYQLQYGRDQIVGDLSPLARWYSIPRPVACRTYSFKIQQVNKGNSYGPWSDVVTHRVPFRNYGRVGRLKVKPGRSAGTLFVSWDNRKIQIDNDCPITGFNLRYTMTRAISCQKKSYDKRGEVTIGADSQGYQITRLCRRAEYSVSVTAVSSEGNGTTAFSSGETGRANNAN